MTEEEMSHLEDLVCAYTIAHQERVPLAEAAERRRLFASGPAKEEHDAVKCAVRAAAPRPRHSDAFVEGYVDDLLQATLDDPARTVGELCALRRVLEHLVATRLYIPLDGIAVEEAEVCRLVRMDADAFERLIVQPFVDIIRVNPVYDIPKGDEAIQGRRQRLQSLRGRTCVEVTTDLDLTGTFAEAETVADDVCDFLQLCVAALRPRQLTNAVRWSNGIVQAWRWSFGVSDGPRPRSNSNGELAYDGPPTIIRPAALARLQECGLLTLSDGLGKRPTTEYAALLRRGVRWFAKGERERHVDDPKLAYVTAVGLFFSCPGNATQRFCEGFAFAMSEDPAVVAQLARAMYHMYASRSETSHEGAFDMESDDDVDQLRWQILEFLTRMAGHAFQAKCDVRSVRGGAGGGR